MNNDSPRKPDVELKVWFDVIGIEAHIFQDNKEIGVIARDFAGDYPIEVSQESMIRCLVEMLDKFTEGK